MALSGLYFPGTFPAPTVLGSLLVLFEEIWCYQAAELDIPQELSGYQQAARLRCVTPVPFGDDLQRFERTVRDLLAHGQEYFGAYLSSMAFDVGGNREEGAGWGIVSALTGRRSESTDEQELWQARLLLQLQEHQDRQAREIDQGLAAFADQRAELFSLMRGEEGTRKRSSGLAARVPDWPRERAEQILRAWAQLFLADQSAASSKVMVTDREVAAGILSTACEKFFKQSPEPLVELRLPCMVARDEMAAPEDLAGGREGHELSAEIGRLLEEAMQGVEAVNIEELRPTFAGVAETWHEYVKQYSGPGLQGTAPLTFYRFPGGGPAPLMARLCNKETEDSRDPAGPSISIMAVLGGPTTEI